MNFAAATVTAGRRRNRRSARPTHASGLSDNRHSRPSTRRPCVHPSAYQARSPAQNPHALPITRGAGEDPYSAAKLPANRSIGSDGIGKPMLSINEAAKTTAKPDVSTPVSGILSSRSLLDTLVGHERGAPHPLVLATARPEACALPAEVGLTRGRDRTLA